MDDDVLVNTYLRGLERGDVQAVTALFAAGALVHSPLYGPVPATEFFPKLFAATSAATLTLRSVLRGQDAQGVATLAFWFHFDWRLPSGLPAPFEVVDVARLDDDGLITELRLVYDTVDVRSAFEADTGLVSWRASDGARHTG